MHLLIRLVVFIWNTFWLRYTALLFIGGFIYLGGLGLTDEAKTYKDGPRAANVETLNADNLKYDYLTLTGFNDSYYSFSYYSETTSDETVDTDKRVVLFYTLQTLAEAEASVAGEQSHAAVVVRQVLPDEKRACVQDDTCLEGGEMTLEGRLSRELSNTSDQEAINMLAEGGFYTVDDTTLYFDANWQPATSGSASTTKNLGLGVMLVAALALPLNLFLRRRKAEQAGSSLPTQEQL